MSLIAIPGLAQPGALWPGAAASGAITATDTGTFTDHGFAQNGPADQGTASETAVITAHVPAADSSIVFDAGVAGIDGRIIGPRVMAIAAELRTFYPDSDGQITV